MEVLIFGGTLYMGKMLCEKLCANGHKLTIVSRRKPDNLTEIEYINADRKSYQQLATKLQNRSFDTVIDMLNYSSFDSSVIEKLINQKIISCGHYIFTSSSHVYLPEGGKELKESAFDPFTYNSTVSDRPIISYSEGKRRAEAYLFQNMVGIPITAIRLPVALGTNDPSERFTNLFEKILEKKHVPLSNSAQPISLVWASDVADFLYWTATKKLSGIYNACSPETFTEGEIYELFLSVLKSKKKITRINYRREKKPFYSEVPLTLECSKATSQGFNFTPAFDWIRLEVSQLLSKRGYNPSPDQGTSTSSRG